MAPGCLCIFSTWGRLRGAHQSTTTHLLAADVIMTLNCMPVADQCFAVFPLHRCLFWWSAQNQPPEVRKCIPRVCYFGELKFGRVAGRSGKTNSCLQLCPQKLARHVLGWITLIHSSSLLCIAVLLNWRHRVLCTLLYSIAYSLFVCSFPFRASTQSDSVW